MSFLISSPPHREPSPRFSTEAIIAFLYELNPSFPFFWAFVLLLFSKPIFGAAKVCHLFIAVRLPDRSIRSFFSPPASIFYTASTFDRAV